MVDWFTASLRQHAEVAFFLTLGIGYLLGKLHFKGFTLEFAVTQERSWRACWWGKLGVTVSPEVKQCFFVLFPVFHRLSFAVLSSFRACAKTD